MNQAKLKIECHLSHNQKFLSKYRLVGNFYDLTDSKLS